MKMTRRQGVIVALTHQRPDQVPYEVHCTVGMEEAMVAHTGSAEYMSKYVKPMIARIDLHPLGTWIKPGYYQDVFGAVWNRTVDKSIGVIENYLVTPDTFKNFKWPQPLPDAHLTACKGKIAQAGDQYRIGCMNFAFWERAWILRGMENLFIDLATDPTFAHEYLTSLCDYNCSVLARALKHLDLDGVHFGDDWGTQNGLQMSPEMWREFIKPYVKRAYGMVRDAGKFVSIHSCGKVQGLFDEMIEIGVNSFNPFQPEVIDVDWATTKYKGKLCFWGGLSTQKTLPFGTPEQIREETKHLIDLGRLGGMIVSPAHSVPPDAKPENMIALLETLRDYSAN